MRLFIVLAYLLTLATRCVRCAVDVDGNQVTILTSETDPAPISDADADTFYPDQHDCPQICADYSNIHSWTRYFSVERLQRCQLPMLLKFSVTQSLKDPGTTVLLRGCTVGGSEILQGTNSPDLTIENPKKASNTYETDSLGTAPACAVIGKEVQEPMRIVTGPGTGHENSTGEDISGILNGMQMFFEDPDNCDETFVFSYDRGTVAGAYVGAGLGKPSIGRVFASFAESYTGSSESQTIAEVCSDERKASRILGLVIDTTGGLPAVQDTLLDWHAGTCSITQEASGGNRVSTTIFDIAGIGVNSTLLSNATVLSNGTTIGQDLSRASARTATDIQRHDTCSHIPYAEGDSCASLAQKCGIRGSKFVEYNKGVQCSGEINLKRGQHVCCSAGDPYKPTPPSQNADGSCAAHLIKDGDSCDDLAITYGITAEDIEKWNAKKTWAWTECKYMQHGYNLCISDGNPPLPPPQEGAECGPIVPGTQPLTDQSISLADVNPCPLKACCSNWGFCGPFSMHCEIHAPEGGGPGTKLPEFENTCISNCGNDIKQNSGAPSQFARVGYYESWNKGRPCLWLDAKNANTDGTYTHMHWGFLDIDPSTWKPIIKDQYNQWEDFKKLSVKRIVSFGGWAYSTEKATYNIIRSAIIDNRELFASNVAQFLNEEGLDGVDIDWEYPGAPDIMVDGQPIGKKTDGVAYLRFLTVLKEKVGSKSVSIAAPASYWYLKAFPIDRISKVIDYIVYMTYDLHGQWDYGNTNAFDACPSGKCIRSHVNLTETRNSLSIITKAGVANNKITVGEASYGRSFHMAQDGCWDPTCEFTGTRLKSDAAPGRCTGEGGYLAYAEIQELVYRGEPSHTFYDEDSDTDVMISKGDYISYMTPITKDRRREEWKKLNFAGSIDWAVDLQEFRSEDLDARPDNGVAGSEGCVFGDSDDLSTGDLCSFACSFDFCPESYCYCKSTGEIPQLPSEDTSIGEIIAYDEKNVDLNRLCKFACKYGYCPDDICTKKNPPEDDTGAEIVDENYVSARDIRDQNTNLGNCQLFKDRTLRDASVAQCYKPCQSKMDEGAAEGRITSYGCLGFTPLNQPIPWERPPGYADEFYVGKCSCDNWLVNEIATTVLDALPMIAQIACYTLMSSLKLVLDIGAEAIPGVGKIVDAGLDMATTAAQMVSYIYPEEEDPEGAFSWWLSPCGGTDLVPDDIKEIFGILSTVADGVSSFSTPKSIGKGSGKKGDDGNPHDQSTPRGRPGGNGGNNGGNNNNNSNKKCKIRAKEKVQRLGAAKNSLRKKSCSGSVTKTEEFLVTSVEWSANAQTTVFQKDCLQKWGQACYHYSSANDVNPEWKTLTCPFDAGTISRQRPPLSATRTWSDQHDKGWRDPDTIPAELNCERDEWPPAYLLQPNDVAAMNSGKNRKGQLVRFMPGADNSGAGSAWKGHCMVPLLKAMSDVEFERLVRAASGSKAKEDTSEADLYRRIATIPIDKQPAFSWGNFGHSQNPAPNAGLELNACWPRVLTPNDPGFALLTYDPWYDSHAMPFDYKVAPPKPKS